MVRIKAVQRDRHGGYAQFLRTLCEKLACALGGFHRHACRIGLVAIVAVEEEVTVRTIKIAHFRHLEAHEELPALHTCGHQAHDYLRARS
jgi:hypothetical protein